MPSRFEHLPSRTTLSQPFFALLRLCRNTATLWVAFAGGTVGPKFCTTTSSRPSLSKSPTESPVPESTPTSSGSKSVQGKLPSLRYTVPGFTEAGATRMGSLPTVIRSCVPEFSRSMKAAPQLKGWMATPASFATSVYVPLPLLRKRAWRSPAGQPASVKVAHPAWPMKMSNRPSPFKSPKATFIHRPVRTPMPKPSTSFSNFTFPSCAKLFRKM
mmetsp:Transcript_76618/g.106411  ORF Transcript_76618/g.106411 Transcript_76618/m.106411 type:complete len:215 (-) Transcript_76618:987-1631(-)